MERGKNKTRVGVVTSSKMDKTVTVDVTQVYKHTKYKKTMKRRSTFKAHDENSECKVGDRVYIIETRPLSRTKRWRVSRVIKSADIVEGEVLDGDTEQGGAEVDSADHGS